MSLIRSLDVLDSRFRPMAEDFLFRCSTAGFRIFVFETLRSDEVQAAYCAQGRKPLAEVNDLRLKAGLSGISEAENRGKITDPPPGGLLTVYKGVGHGNGTAMDVVPMTPNGKLLWSAAPEVWMSIGEIGELCGMIWGGRWKPINERTGLGFDPGHFQLPR
jgi:hypothetical protein